MGENSLSMQEKDLVDRTKKKVKGGDHSFSSESTPISYVILHSHEGVLQRAKPSFKNVVDGKSQSDESDGEFYDSMDDTEGEGTDKVEQESVPTPCEIDIEEKKVGSYDCPSFVLSSTKETRIREPWKFGVIVKLLGHRIGFKTLETQLKGLWVKKGIITVIDLGNDYFLVNFSHKDDQIYALTEGPWLIYDHDLIV